MKKFIGLISLFILVLLLVSSISVGAYDNSATPMIEVGSLACNKGDVVSVPIYMSNNPGVTSVNLKIEYNSDYLNLIDIEDGKLLGEAVHSDDYEANPYTLSWENDTATENFLSNGTIATIKFEVAENSPAGRYDIFITSDKQLDCEGQIVDFTIVSGAIDVKENKLGDANGDGVLDTKDRIHISRYVADWKDYRNIDTEASDVTCDGIVDSEDRMFVSRHLANWKDYEQFTYKSNGKIFKLKGIILESSEHLSVSPSAKPYVMVEITNGMGNEYGIYGNTTHKMYVGISGAEKFVGREVLLFVMYNKYDDTLTIKSVYEVDNEKLTINISDIVSVSNYDIKYYVDDSKKAIAIVSSSANWYYNNVPVENAFAPDLYDIMNMNGTIELSLLNDETTDGDYDTVHITAYDVFVVDEVNATSKVVRAKFAPVLAPNRIKYDESNGDVRATLTDANGNELDWASLEEYDVLSVKYIKTDAKSIYEAKVIENVVTGTVTGISGAAKVEDGEKYIEIDGTEYKVAFNAEDEKYIKLGDSGTFYLDAYDNVVYHTTVKNNNYAFVVDTNVGDAFDGAKIKLLTKESDIVDLEFANKISVWYKGAKASNISIDNLDELFYYDYEFEELRGMNIDDLEGMIVTYTLNNAGLINSIEIPAYDKTEDYLCMSGYGDLIDYDITNLAFKLDGSRLYVTDDTVIFYAPKNGSTEDFVVLDIADLSHDQSMTDAYVYDVDDDRNIGAIIVKGDIIPGTEEPPAIPSEIKNATFVTNVAYSVDEEGYDVIRVTGYNGLEKVSYICESGSEPAIGSLVVPVYAANGDIDYFNVVGRGFSPSDEYEEVAYGNLSPVYEDGEYISPIDSRRKFIIVNGEEYKVDSSTNIYVYDETLATRVKYRVGEYLEYVEFDIWDSWDDDYELYIDGEKSYADVAVYMYIYNGNVVDLVYYIYK